MVHKPLIMDNSSPQRAENSTPKIPKLSWLFFRGYGVVFTVLGSPGDVWDAQKDITADSIGALFATGLFAWLNRFEIARLGR